jgi:RNA polymerase subunit RPABC4/transcription elongation factor Spt4
MTLRKCPSCRDIVGAQSEICPRCGVNFRVAGIRRVVRWALLLVVLLWLMGHFVLKVRFL